MMAHVRTDSSAALAISQRVGLGKVRHLQAKYIWIQERHTGGSLVLHKVKGELNPADLLTRRLPEVIRHMHFSASDFERRGGEVEATGRQVSNVARVSRNRSVEHAPVSYWITRSLGESCVWF